MEGRKSNREFNMKINTEGQTPPHLKSLGLPYRSSSSYTKDIKTNRREPKKKANQTDKQSNFGKGISSHKTLSMLNSNMLVF